MTTFIEILVMECFNVTNMYRMFLRANVFNQDIGGWNIPNVTDMDTIFKIIMYSIKILVSMLEM